MEKHARPGTAPHVQGAQLGIPLGPLPILTLLIDHHKKSSPLHLLYGSCDVLAATGSCVLWILLVVHPTTASGCGPGHVTYLMLPKKCNLTLKLSLLTLLHGNTGLSLSGAMWALTLVYVTFDLNPHNVTKSGFWTGVGQMLYRYIPIPNFVILGSALHRIWIFFPVHEHKWAKNKTKFCYNLKHWSTPTIFEFPKQYPLAY